MTDVVADLLTYIDRSPTPYHAVAETAARLERFAAQGVRGHLVQVLDPAEETLTYVSAGHNPVLLFGAQGAVSSLAHQLECLARPRVLWLHFASSSPHPNPG